MAECAAALELVGPVRERVAAGEAVPGVGHAVEVAAALVAVEVQAAALTRAMEGEEERQGHLRRLTLTGPIRGWGPHLAGRAARGRRPAGALGLYR